MSTTSKPAARPPTTPLTTREKIELGRQRALQARAHARTAHHHVKGVQKQAAPFVGMGLLVLAAAALNAAKDASDADTTILAATAATCIVVAVVAATRMRRRLDDSKALYRGIAFVTTCAGWLTWTTAMGLTWNATAFLAAVGSVLSLHWWNKHRIPNTVPPAEPEPVSVEKPVSYYQQRWDEFVACPGGQLPGSRLESPTKIRSGFRYLLHLVPGKQSLVGLMSAMVLIRGGLGLTVDQDVIAEKHPVLAEPAVLLTVVTKSPVKQAHQWPGPAAFVGGVVHLGPYVDGEGVAGWTVYTEDRMKGGFIQGGSGAGKSRTIEAITMSAAASITHPTVIWFGDGQGNSSSPMLMKHADYSARTHEQIGQMLACAMLVMELRQDENGLEEEVGFAPTEARPGLLVTIDECHKPVSKIENPEHWTGIQYMYSTIAREGQKVGVQLLLATQESTLGAFGGAGNAAEMVRSNLLMGNGIMMRSKDANARQVFKVPDDPSQFPELPGYALMVAGDSGGRTAPFRSYHLTNEQRQVWPDRIRWRSLDEGSGNAAGITYLMRAEMAEMAKAEIRRRVDARRSGAGVQRRIDEVLAAADNAVVVQGGDGSAVLGDLPDVAEFPTWNPVTDRVQERQMHDGHRKVLDALQAGLCKPTPIAAATGYSVRRVHDLLDELIDEFGQAERVINPQGSQKHGEYRPMPDPVR